MINHRFLTWILLFAIGALNAQKQEALFDELDPQYLNKLVENIKKSKEGEDHALRQQLLSADTKDQFKAKKLRDIGYFFYKNRDYKRSLFYFDEALSFLKSPGSNRQLYEIYMYKGNAYLNSWKNLEAIEMYYLALDIAEGAQNIDQVILVQTNIALIRRRMNQLDKALSVCKNSLRYMSENDREDSQMYANMLTIISETYLDMKAYDSVLYYADIGIKKSIAIDHYDALADLKTKKGIVFYEEGEYSRALTYLADAEKLLIIKDVKEKKYIINTLYFQAASFFKQELYEKAKSKLLQIISLTGDTKANTRIIDTYLLLADCYRILGNADQATLWYQNYIVLNEKSQNDKTQTITKIHEKDAEELGIKIEKLVENQRKRKIYLKSTLITSITLAVLLVSFLLFYFRKQTANKRKFEELIQTITALKHTKKPTTSNQAITKEIIIDDKKTKQVLKHLDKMEEQAYFLNTDCNLRSMAKKAKTNATYLTKIINTAKAKNFNDYINDLRIEYVLKRLKEDKTFRLFSIKSIANEIGYKSDYSFTKHFKAKTGLNPSYYIKKIKELEKKST